MGAIPISAILVRHFVSDCGCFPGGLLALYRDGREKSVQILGASCAPGQELEADMVRIRPYEVESCVWYAGEEVVSREGRLHSYTRGKRTRRALSVWR